ncbi:hypothetical protein BD324DRAFT_313400 [Kockovaella imperatae]|uniref:Uncharacterized protein n=1 Tax=Kockovaella imperatae TaxID=4999 RepID=A0A1Y1UM75_9TREE|nr:hypothetical protein BD324DRAFT_313400 [Kockovaella imperatae]ORX39150.1 hypothetical protein BD324DRAFT_313400 [Kockovaella imperatae]
MREPVPVFVKVPKRFSDYYHWKKIKIERHKEKERQQLAGKNSTTDSNGAVPLESERRPGPEEAGPSLPIPHKLQSKTSAAAPSPPSTTPAVVNPSSDLAPKPAAKPVRVTARPPAPVSEALDSLFEDEEPSASNTRTDQPMSSSTVDKPPAIGNGKKRKVVNSPDPGPTRKSPKVAEPLSSVTPATLPAPPPSIPLRIQSSAPSRMAEMGKIAKKSSEVLPIPQPSFGDLQPGIFDEVDLDAGADSSAKGNVSLANPPANSAATSFTPTLPSRSGPAVDESRLFMDAEDDGPQKPRPIIGSKPSPPSPSKESDLVIAPSAPISSSAPHPPQSVKVPTTERPKYQQPVRIKKIDDMPIPRKGPPQSAPTAPRKLSGNSTSVQPARYSPPNPTTMKSPHGVEGGRTPPGSLGSSLAPAYPPAPMPAAPSLTSFRPTHVPTQPKNFRAPRPITSTPYLPPLHRANLASPPRTALAPQPAVPAVSSAYNAAADPRRKGSTMPSPVLPSMPSPLGSADSKGGRTPTHPSSDPKIPHSGSRPEFAVPLEIACAIPLRDMSDLTFLELHLLPGAATSIASPTLCQRLLTADQGKMSIIFEEVDPIAVTGNIRLGAKVVEWVRAARIDNKEPGSKEAWEYLKDVIKDGKIYVSYVELTVSSPQHHYAILLGLPSSIDINHIGTGQWSLPEISAAIFVLQIPLTSVAPPELPNPVRANMIMDTKPVLPAVLHPASLLASYGISDEFLGQYRNRTVLKYPGGESRRDLVDSQLVAAFKRCDISGIKPNTLPSFVILLNQKFGKTIRSGSLRDAVPRETDLYVVGPSLSLYPSQYGLRRVWQTGGLITFSPTFILHSPEKFAAIMSLIRISGTWAAYVLPSIIEWCQQSWTIKTRCRDPAAAFDALTTALFLDEAVLRMSGSLADSGGGLAVSCAPPCIHDTQGCLAWHSWLVKLSAQSTLDEIAAICQGISTQTFVTNPTAPASTSKLNLVDIEQAQLADLTAMRMRPHLLPYRRYLYVGEASLSRADKEKLGASVEFVAAEDFSAVFSGTV